MGNETGNAVIAHGSVEFCEATPIALVDESKEPLYGRETERDLRSAYVDASRDFLYIFLAERAARGERGGGRWQTLYFFFFSLFSRPRAAGLATV